MPHWLMLPFSLMQLAFVSRLEMWLSIFFMALPIEWLDGFAAADSTAKARLLSTKMLIVTAINTLVFILSPFTRKHLFRKNKSVSKPLYRL